jgi:hypothetical protein
MAQNDRDRHDRIPSPSVPDPAIRIEVLQETLRHPSGTLGLNIPSTDIFKIMIVRIT